MIPGPSRQLGHLEAASSHVRERGQSGGRKTRAGLCVGPDTVPESLTISESRAAFLWALVGLCLIAANTTWQVALATRAPIPAQYDYDEGVYAATADAFARGDRLYTEVFLSQPPLLIVMIGGMFHLIGTSLLQREARSPSLQPSGSWPC